MGVVKYVYLNTKCGQIKGIGKRNCTIYRGVRYAAAKRWASPQIIESWEGTYDATQDGPACPQNDAFLEKPPTPADQFYHDECVEKKTLVYSEDCLNMTIWTPEDAHAAPVLVFFHGGSYNTGYGSTPMYSGEKYCENGVILVSVNYRLNVFACACDGAHGGNYGLQDQIAALCWIKRNIEAFGGDPERITISGESAGAMSVQNILCSPAAKGLVSGAIMMSGGGILKDFFVVKDDSDAKKIWQDMKAVLHADTLSELEDIPPGELFSAWRRVLANNPAIPFPATPIVDGITIPDLPETLVKAGRYHAVPCMIGLLSEDMWPYSLYQTALEWGLLSEKYGHMPVYGYYMDQCSREGGLGAFHGSDLWYVFGQFEKNWREYTDADIQVSDTMVRYISNFTQTCSPNGDALPVWTPISSQDTSFMHFAENAFEMCMPPVKRLMEFQQKNKPFPGM